MQLRPYKSVGAERWHCIDYESTKPHSGHTHTQRHAQAHVNTPYTWPMSALYILWPAVMIQHFYRSSRVELNAGHEEEEKKEEEEEEGVLWHPANPSEWRMWGGWKGKSFRIGVGSDVIWCLEWWITLQRRGCRARTHTHTQTYRHFYTNIYSISKHVCTQSKVCIHIWIFNSHSNTHTHILNLMQRWRNPPTHVHRVFSWV